MDTTRKPSWLRAKLPSGPGYAATRRLVDENKLHTVCQSAQCPNLGECWSRGTATVMILGNICTRSCNFCAIQTGRPTELDLGEPARVARADLRLGLEVAPEPLQLEARGLDRAAVAAVAVGAVGAEQRGALARVGGPGRQRQPGRQQPGQQRSQCRPTRHERAFAAGDDAGAARCARNSAPRWRQDSFGNLPQPPDATGWVQWRRLLVPDLPLGHPTIGTHTPHPRCGAGTVWVSETNERALHHTCRISVR